LPNKTKKEGSGVGLVHNVRSGDHNRVNANLTFANILLQYFRATFGKNIGDFSVLCLSVFFFGWPVSVFLYYTKKKLMCFKKKSAM